MPRDVPYHPAGTATQHLSCVALGFQEIAAGGSQESMIHEDTEALFPKLLYLITDYCQPPLTRIPTVNCDGCTQLLDLAHSSLARAPKKERPRP